MEKFPRLEISFCLVEMCRQQLHTLARVLEPKEVMEMVGTFFRLSRLAALTILGVSPE